jgi:hypothetical protein
VSIASIKGPLHHYLASTPGVQELAGDRVFPVNVVPPGEERPAVTFFVTSSPKVQYLNPGPGDLPHPTVQINCWGRTGREAEQLAWAVRGDEDSPRLDGFRGWMGGDDGKVFVQGAKVEDAPDDLVPPAHGESDPTHLVSLQAVIWYED